MSWTPQDGAGAAGSPESQQHRTMPGDEARPDPHELAKQSQETSLNARVYAAGAMAKLGPSSANVVVIVTLRTSQFPKRGRSTLSAVTRDDV